MSYTAGQSPEVLVDQMTALIRQNIESALASIRTDRSDARIATPKPKEYFISSNNDPYSAPAVFVVAEDIDWQKEQTGANFVNAKARINVSIVVEDRTVEILTRMVYRYATALKTVLDQTNLTSSNSKVKMTVVVKRTSFSALYTTAQKANETSGVFRKEALLECEVVHFEKF
jgi:hypothetical protein